MEARTIDKAGAHARMQADLLAWLALRIRLMREHNIPSFVSSILFALLPSFPLSHHSTKMFGNQNVWQIVILSSLGLIRVFARGVVRFELRCWAISRVKGVHQHYPLTLEEGGITIFV